MNKTSVQDLLFNLVLVFFVLFSLAFFITIVVNNKEDNKENINNRNNILIKLEWEQDCDLDLWLLLPDGRKVFYNNREQPPAFLDVDIVTWQVYQKLNGEKIIIKDNEEIISIREPIDGEYAINVHLYNSKEETEIAFKVTVLDVYHKNIIYTDSRTIKTENKQEHIVRFSTEPSEYYRFRIFDITDTKPIYFVG